MNILLDYEDFRALTNGKVIERNGVKIALKDIGFHVMKDIIDTNIKRQKLKKG